jgi:hypothetical protein
MKKISLATKILTVAILTVPFVYEKDDNGGLKLRAVLYDINYSTVDGKKNFTLTIGGLIKDQIKVIKKLFSECKCMCKFKKKEADIDSDFEDIIVSEEDIAFEPDIVTE